MPSGGDQQIKKPVGRLTRNSRKAAQPFIIEGSPPTHPSKVDTNPNPVENSAQPTFPALQSISQLKDYPNLSTLPLPIPEVSLAKLPHSAPSSPISKLSTLEIELGNPLTPSNSPNQTSVILANPNIINNQQFPRASTPALVGQSPAVGSWDNYLDNPTYKLDSEFWQSRDIVKVNKVRLVSTDVSDLGDLSVVLDSSSNTNQVLDQGLLATKNIAMEKAAEDLADLETKVRDMCSDCDPNLITSDSAPSMRDELEKIGETRDRYRSGVRKFVKEYADSLGSPEKLQWESDMKNVVTLVNQHKFNVMAKVNQLLPAASRMTAFEHASIELQKKQLEIQQTEASSKKDEAIATAQPLKTLILEKCNDLDSDLEQISVGELVTGDDLFVTRTMQKLSDWKRSLESITSTYQDFQTKTAVHKLSDSEHSAVNSAVEKTKSLLGDIISVAEDQDQKRQLFSLDTTSRVEQVKWPVFSGDPGEDYFKFKKDFLEAAAQNKTSLRNQVTKLKENLRGYAKSLVPNSISSISRALEILEHACGDSLKVVMHRIENLMGVGPWPPDGTKDCYTRQIKWVIKVQTLLEEIVELANSKEELGDIVYNREKLSQVLKLFPTFMVDKFVKMPGYKEEKYRLIIKKLDEFKLTSQNREMIYGSGGQLSQSKEKSAVSQSSPAPSVPFGHITFPKPQNLPDCRICKVLQAQGNTSGLFEKHVSDYVTGCPLFASLGNAQRLIIAKEAKLCLKCMGKDIKFGPQHNRQCPVISKKSSYSCKSDKCFFHMWVCGKHEDDNRAQMQKFSDQLRTKSGIKLVFTAVIEKEIPKTPEFSQPDILSTHTYTTDEGRGIKRAVRNLHRFNKKRDPNVETISPPEGKSIFMFFGAEGISNPVYTFFDSGCTEAIIREGIPENELRGTLLTKGPFKMGGVGDTLVEAKDEWLVQFNRVDGRKQLVRGVTMDQITCDFPLINTTKAEAEVKASDPTNVLLQNCKLPPMAGGRVDVLLGIQYSSIFPVPVRQLDCGLTIYESRLVAHDRKVNSLIGGPHSSFQFLADQIGNPSRLLAHFVDGLQKIRKLGPPSIPSNPFTTEEEMFALVQNSAEDQNIHSLLSLKLRESASRSDACFNCLMSFDDTESPETLREIRKLRLEQEPDLDLNYRCIKCRDCTACKDADRTEAISLKEEAEMEQVDKSVKLDLDNKQIICTLPLKGEERDYLTTNYEQACKILEQQCRLYYGQEETRALIIKAFDKLFVNGHIAFMKDLSPEEKALFCDKPIHYFIPWRIAFSDSATTPARPVLDASSRTKVRPDGSGGKSLNNLVCQGKVETINLLKLILGFRIGRFAVTGDLAQFYNSFKLSPVHWNLQRFLYKQDLNPESPVLEGCIKTLIYGVASVSAQTENGMRKLSNLIKDSKPSVKTLIEDRMYVDDAGESKSSLEECQQLAKDSDEVFSLVNLNCKSWNFSGRDPDEKVSKDGVSLGVGGFRWFPKLDVFELKIPLLHFGKKRRGKLREDTKFFSGEVSELDKFVPKVLSRRMVTSKFASIFDPTGKLGPILSEAKELLRDTIEATSDWDQGMSVDLRNRWLKQFILWEKLCGLKFDRAVMPMDAVDSKLRIIVLADYAKKLHVIGSWGGFKLKSGNWSCKHILSRNLLADKNQTIPKGELQSLTNASNMCWLLRKILSDWVESYVICGDSVIALCWVSAENKSLSMFHRNRVVQIRRGSEMSSLFHVATEENLADLGTRPEKIRLTDIGPDSQWENGKPWMHLDISIAVETGVLKPIAELRGTDEKESDEYKDGLIFGKDLPDVFCNKVSHERVDLLQQRIEFSNYLVVPTKYPFRKVVRILAIVYSFIRKCQKQSIPVNPQNTENLKFTLFHTYPISSNPYIEKDNGCNSALLAYFAEKDTQLTEQFFLTQRVFTADKSCYPTDVFIHDALTYLYKKASREVLQFNPKSKVDKLAVLKDEILFSKGRIIDGMNFVQTGGLDIPDLGQLGIKSHVPVVDRHSPLAYSIGNHVHWELSKHRGIETCHRISLGHVWILQGANLYKEIGEQCITCCMKRKRYLVMPMGPISDEFVRHFGWLKSISLAQSRFMSQDSAKILGTGMP